MQATSLTTGSRMLPFKSPSALGPTAQASDSVGDEFLATKSDDIRLIPANLVVKASIVPGPLRSTSPQLVEAQSLGEQVAAAAVPGLGQLSAAKSSGDKAEILALFDQWNAALQTRDPEKMLELYAPDAILLPTLSNKVRHNHAEIKDYFEHFLPKGPKGTLDESNVRIFGDVAINSGVYTFSFDSADAVQARYTYVYRKLDGEWKIVEHHSSAMPEKKNLATLVRDHLP